MDIGLLLTAFAFGFAALMLRLPPLVGFLIAGFVLHAYGFENTSTTEMLSDLGIMLLLFGIGLKSRLRTLARTEVWATFGLFAIIATAVATAGLSLATLLGLPLTSDLDLGSMLIVAFGLSFSSTVFAVKALERTNETGSLGGRLAVGVLILQDLLAVAFLVATNRTWPSPWAVAVLGAFLLLRPALFWILDRSGHGEILILLGFSMALGVGGALFELVDLKPDLGALVAGFLLATHPRAEELADRLLAFKDLFLVGFFLSIGLGGAPPAGAWILALLAVALLPTRSFVLFWLFTRFRLRSRTALHASLTLSTYSEFGLIVASAALAEGLLDQQWVAVIGVAVAASFVVASTTNALRYRLYDRWFGFLSRLERQPILADDAVIDTGPARILVFGMGRIGTGAYDELIKQARGPVVGVDRDADVVEQHTAHGRTTIRGDSLDRDFWERVRFHPDIELVVAAMSNHPANLECVTRIKQFLPAARIATVAMYPDQVTELREAGVDVARNLYEEAGQALADDAVAVIWETDS